MISHTAAAIAIWAHGRTRSPVASAVIPVAAATQKISPSAIRLIAPGRPSSRVSARASSSGTISDFG